MKTSTRWPLTPRGAGALVVAIGCLVVSYQVGVPELRWVFVFLVLAVLGGVVSVRLFRRSDTVSRSLQPDLPVAGGEATVRLRVRRKRGFPGVTTRWTDALSAGLTARADGTVPPWHATTDDSSSVDLSYRMRTLSRGHRTVGPLTLVATDPFGLARRAVAVGDASEITVAPAIVPFAALTQSAGEAGGSLHSATHQLGQGTDNLIPRAYVPGDSMRRIHWRASAHRGELMVRQEEQETTPDATVVLDRGARRWSPLVRQSPGEDPDFERGVSACVSAAALLVHEGYDVSVIDAVGHPLAEKIESGDTAGVETLAIALSTIIGTRDTLTELRGLFAGSTTGPVVLVTGHLDQEDVALVAPVAHDSTFPVLLAMGAPSASLAEAAATGWRVGVAEHDVELPRAWATATGREGSDVRA